MIKLSPLHVSLTLILFLSICIQDIHSQSPGDLNNDVTVNSDWSSVATIANTFNQSRREEETQLGLGANSIQDLAMPTQATWNAFSDDQKALYILNDERTSRAGINYGAGAVKGLPFNGVEANIDGVAQNWAQYNIDNNIFEHCHPTMNPMDCPSGRIDNAYPMGCTEFGGGIENLFASSQGTALSTSDALLSAIFGWNYKDAGSGWGHRQANLSQSYNDDYGDVNEEGLVGFGIAQTNNPAVTWKTLVVVNFTNPVAAPVCNTYNITVNTPVVGAAPPQGYTCATAFVINSVGTYNAPAADQGNGAASQANNGGVATHAIWYMFTPPTTGMINVRSCNIPANNGVVGGGHNHIFPTTSTCLTVAADVDNVVHTTSNSCGNQTATNDIPVTAGVPIFIEWDDAVGGAAFTWILEYVNTGGCVANVMVNGPTVTGTTQASMSITTNGAVSATAAIFSAPTINLNAGFSVPSGTTFETNSNGCAGGPMEDGSCMAPYTLTCGTPLNLTSVGGNNNWTTYQDGNGMGTGYNGPEKVHTLIVPGNTTSTVTLNGFTTYDLDFFVTPACDNNNVISFAGAQNGAGVTEIAAIANNTPNPVAYFIIVDTFGSVNGEAYTISCN